ncbi:MAG: hypothetical protein ABIT05_03670 [Chitinophagaceae bacterium]
MDKPPRKRLGPIAANALPAVADPWKFEANLCTPNARIVAEVTEEIDVNLWYDKHYHDRHFIGDKNGKRDGIDMDVVEGLVLRSIKHLFLYSGMFPNLHFINHKPTSRATRLVLQESVNGVLLNVVIEVHFVKISLYEITVKTAMRHDEFDMSDNQYVIELDGDGALLKKFENKALRLICQF